MGQKIYILSKKHVAGAVFYPAQTFAYFFRNSTIRLRQASHFPRITRMRQPHHISVLRLTDRIIPPESDRICYNIEEPTIYIIIIKRLRTIYMAIGSNLATRWRRDIQPLRLIRIYAVRHKIDFLRVFKRNTTG